MPVNVPTVFISYSHVDESWKDKLVPHLRSLEQAGVDMRVWEDRQIDGGAKWYPAIQDAIAKAKVAVLLISSDFLKSEFCVKEEVPALIKRQEEKGMLLIPILVRPCVWKAHRWLKDRQMLPRDGKSVAVDYAGALTDTVFAAVTQQVWEHFEVLSNQRMVEIEIPATIRGIHLTRDSLLDLHAAAPKAVETRPRISAERIDLSRLPETGAALFGRDKELELLDRAWTEAESRIVVFKAGGGVGKSTLVNHWLAEMERDQFRGASDIFGWSFYSQGVRANGAASAEPFIDAALRFFGDADPALGSPWDKGARLAHLVGSKRALLVLDGLEPLQSGDAFDRGKLRDPGVESLLRGLARQSHGLCVVTTRETVTDINGRESVVTLDLEQISPEAGRALLRTLRVVGSDAELEVLATRFGPHALAIRLLGVYLREQPGHGVANADAIEKFPSDSPLEKVLAALEQWLGESPEREILHVLGLFDRPADDGCIGALRAAPVIIGLTERLVTTADAVWQKAVTRLERLQLIHVIQRDEGSALLDAHPLLREYFAKRLKQHPETWKAAHRRLYEHLCASTKEGDQPTIEELQPLYRAVAHGCQAGMQQEVCDRVYRDRILRGTKSDGFYSTKKLGAFGSDLGAVACFFDLPWSRVSPTLMETDQAWLLNQASVRLRALGRLTEALEPMRANLKLRVEKEEWRHAPSSAGNLSELELTLGEVTDAVADAEQSVTYAERSGDAFQRTSKRATYADALHQSGRRDEAAADFLKAEALQAEYQPHYPRLYSMRGFRYCDLLLSPAEVGAWRAFLYSSSGGVVAADDTVPMPLRSKSLSLELRGIEALAACRTVSERAAQTLDWVTHDFTNASIFTIALDHLTLGRALLYAVILKSANGTSPSSQSNLQLKSDATYLQHAVDGIRRAGQIDYLPRGLLSRAWLRALESKRTGLDSAQSDLDEAWEIAERGSMPLCLADIHLYRARLFGGIQSEVKYPWQSPRYDLDEAWRLVKECGYWRRKEELEDAEEAAKYW
jgi:tetratricopeptide (TPR) repeat protein